MMREMRHLIEPRDVTPCPLYMQQLSWRNTLSCK